MDFIKRKAEKYAQANISTAVIFGCHFRWDYMPFFTILHDYLATVAQELKQYDIELIDHHSVNLIHRYSSVEEMRRVMQHSGPHIPFSPSREAAENWEYKGKRLNDWRMIDVKNGEPLFFLQYAGEGFCHRNPEFREAYYDYAKNLIKDTGITGIMADDAMYYRSFHACGCRYCREELKNRAGIDLPPIQDTNFWGNWDNPAGKHWIDLRFDSTAGFYKGLREVVPENFHLMACGASSASAGAVDIASNAEDFLQGNNYVNLEFSGNTPPYKHDPVTANISVSERLVSASHHLACAREYNAGCYGTDPAKGLDFFTQSVEEFHQVFETNLVWNFMIARQAAIRMKEQGKGALVFISSNTAYRSIPNRAAYCASKGGINALVKALALDLGRFGIRCNAVLPGTIKTERWKSMGNKQIVNGELTPIGDISDYQDIANAAYFLGTDLSKNITGVELPVDGGMSCQLYPELLTTLKREKLANQQ